MKTTRYFAGLDSAKLESIKGFLFERKAQRDEFILEEGGPGEALYFVVSGVVKIFKTSTEGKEQILRLIHPGESFNEVPVFDGVAIGIIGPPAVEFLCPELDPSAP